MTDPIKASRKRGTKDEDVPFASLSTDKARQAIGQRLRTARSLLNLSQVEFALAVGASKRAIQDNESGKNVPGGQVLAGLAELGINVNWLLTGKGAERIDAQEIANSQPVRLDSSKLASAIAGVRRVLQNTGTTADDEGQAELAAVLYEMFEQGAALEAAERVVASMMRTVSSAARPKQG